MSSKIRTPRSALAWPVLSALSALSAALLTAGCGGGPAAPPAAAKTGAVAQPAAASASPNAGNADLCGYLTVDQVKQALQYSDTIEAGPDSTTGFTQCVYQAPDNGFVRAQVAVHPGRKDFDDHKSLYGSADCTSAGIGDESEACPKSDPGRVVFVQGGQSVTVSVTNIQSISEQQGTDSTQAALALAKIVAGEL
jgi:hypothetical protein